LVEYRGRKESPMPATELHPRESEHERVARWRADRLERAGYSAEQASELAGRTDVDLHGAIELVENGCSPEVAVQILL
jgi:hypothetical protein